MSSRYMLGLTLHDRLRFVDAVGNAKNFSALPSFAKTWIRKAEKEGVRQ
jgi:hypothetical protein